MTPKGAQCHGGTDRHLTRRTAQGPKLRQEREHRVDAACGGAQQKPQAMEGAAGQLCRRQQEQIVDQQIQQEHSIQIHHHIPHLARPL